MASSSDMGLTGDQLGVPNGDPEPTTSAPNVNEEEKKRKLEEQVTLVEAEVQQLKKNLLAPADTPFPFTPSIWAEPKPLRFRKLSHTELIATKDDFPYIPPLFATHPWVMQNWKTLPKEMQDYWGQPRKPTKEEGQQVRKVTCQVLALTSLDGKSEEDFQKMQTNVIEECFQFVADVSGFSEDAVELLDWFRKQQRGAGIRLDLPRDAEKATVRAFEAAARIKQRRDRTVS